MKKKIQRFNNNPFMTKQVRKAIMHRSRLKKVTEIAHLIQKTTQFLYKSFEKNKKKEYFETINVKDINDNKKFWKTIRPSLVTKV